MSSIPIVEKTFFLQEGCFVVRTRNVDVMFPDSSNENATFEKIIGFASLTIKGLIQDNCKGGIEYLNTPFDHLDLLSIRLDKKKKSEKYSHD